MEDLLDAARSHFDDPNIYFSTPPPEMSSPIDFKVRWW